MPLLHPTPMLNTTTDLFIWVNTTTNGVFWPFSALALFLTLTFSLKKYATEKAIATASFVTAIYTIGLRMMGLVSTLIMVLFILFTAGSIIYLALSGDKST